MTSIQEKLEAIKQINFEIDSNESKISHIAQAREDAAHITINGAANSAWTNWSFTLPDDAMEKIFKIIEEHHQNVKADLITKAEALMK
jgi:3-dehydroquinate dehydratase